MLKVLLPVIFLTSLLSAQSPEPAFNPMTANNSRGINTSSHILYWENPTGVLYNKTYLSSDSLLVVNMDPTVMIQDGYPSMVYNAVPAGALNSNTKYYWRTVEYNSSGSNPSPVWYFITQPSHILDYAYHFTSGLEGWEYAGPMGASNWAWWNYSGTGSTPGEIRFRWDPIFEGDSYMMSPVIPAPSGLNIDIEFRFYEDWWSNVVVIGCAYTLDNGSTWQSIWEIEATGNVGPLTVNKNLNIPGTFRLGFYFTGNSNDIDFYHIDDVLIQNNLNALPPSFLKAEANNSEHKVVLNWNAGSIPGGDITGYRIQRKTGMPADPGTYETIGTTDAAAFTFEDYTIVPGSSYTYRVCSVSPAGYFYGNEATAYTPLVVPVELISFTALEMERNIILNWKTASETNNQGFEIERIKDDESWERTAFIKGNGTTTDEKSYSFTDNNLQNGKYSYRLKQVDYDGTFSYSKVIEAEINIPETFELFQNYPNPFNPVTTIQFSLPESDYVTLKVYDLLGKELITLAEGEKYNAGIHKLEFDASSAASGMYIYKLTAGHNTSVKKLQVLK